MSLEFLHNYSPNDFFYIGANEMPSISECTAVAQIQCDVIDSNNQDDCIMKEKCKNKLLLEKIQHADNGASEKHQNTKDQFNRTILQTCNLTIGIIALSYLAYRYRRV